MIKKMIERMIKFSESIGEFCVPIFYFMTGFCVVAWILELVANANSLTSAIIMGLAGAMVYIAGFYLFWKNVSKGV